MQLNDVFNSEGLLKQHFTQYEIREGQVKMATLVAQALKERKSAVIEGATGIGKSFAYLIPILMTNEMVIVSTSNKNLQNQLDKKDLPTLQKILGHEISWTVLKGKNNYFCHEHFENNQDEIRNELLKSKQGYDFQEADALIQAISKWVGKEKIGDLEFLPFDINYKVKELMACDSQTKHEKESDGAKFCFASKARERALSSQIILVNHTLLALDIALRKETEGKAGILPVVKVIVIDEAHEFERASLLAFSDDISIMSLYHFLNWSFVKKHYKKTKSNALANEFRKLLNRYIPEKGERYYAQRKVTKFEGLEPIISGIDDVISTLKKLNIENEKIQIKVREIIKEGSKLQKRLADMMKEDENMLRWAEARDDIRGNPIIRLKAVPLDISGLLNSGLFSQKVIICTSATLAVNNKFDFFRQQVGMPSDNFELVVPSPFDYKRQALVFISDGSQEKEWEVEQLLKYSKGRAFVLFTSYREMQKAYDLIHSDYPKLIQGEDGMNRPQLLEKFKNTPNAILFATKSFWEGVDVQGDQLSLVVIWKIPFENPKDLIFSSKCDRINEKAGKSVAFFKYAIPDACLKLKQGVGRLIRSATDTGVIALMDSRVNYAQYKDMIIGALPPSYRTQQLIKVKNFYNK